ncbi:MAG: S8 family serine peptidase [Fimbriimonas sp.]
MRKDIQIALAASMLALTGLASAQNRPDVVALEFLRARVENRLAASHARAMLWSDRLGIPSFVDDEGSFAQLIGFDRGPKYLKTQNLNAADTVSTDELWPGGTSGLNLTGNGVRLGVWDGGRVQTAHPEFGGRAVQRDSPSSTSGHATHVAGTMVASGIVAAARGMSYQANLDCYDWNGDLTEMTTAAANGLNISNHSYGYVVGWSNNLLGDGRWAWLGDTTISTTEDWNFGYYDSTAQDLDSLIYSANTYLPVIAAANDRFEGPSTQPVSHWALNASQTSWVLTSAVRDRDGGTSGYDTLPPGYQTSKNALTVGSIDDLIGGWRPTSTVTVSSYSGRGPTDDGRIKPDLVANGASLYSTVPTNSYASSSGTSMASPNLSGSLGLVLQNFRSLNGFTPRSSTLKAIAVQTADEAGTAGPDYNTGWGVLNTLKAAQLVSADFLRRDNIFEKSLATGASFSRVVYCDGTTPLRATIAWIDPAGTLAPAVLDGGTRMLVNDLDLRISSGATTYLPYRLDRLNPSTAATTADNIVDNVEQIRIATPPAGLYTITVTAKGAMLPSGSQSFSLVVSGHRAPSVASLQVTPGRVAGGTSVPISGVVTLDSAAPKGGAVIALASTSTATTLPASVTIPEGQTSRTFSITTSAVTVAQTATITATFASTSQSASLLVSKGPNEALFVSQSVPSVMTAGQVYPVSITMRNTGTTTWTSSYGVRTQNPLENLTWGVNQSWIPGGVTVAPGATRTFAFNVTAPSTGGNYNFQWRMRQSGVEYFGEFSPNTVITVLQSPNDSAFVSQSVPTTMVAGQTYSVSVTFQNTGTNTWVGSGSNAYGMRTQNPLENTAFGTSAVWLPSAVTVAPGASRTFTFNVTAPATPGTYNFQWRMRQAGIAYFGQFSTNRVITVTP